VPVVALEPVIPLEETFDGVVGLEILEVTDDVVRGRVPVRTSIKQPMGLVHGGVYATIAESLSSMATFVAVQEDGNIAVGSSNNTTFLRPITDGHVNATARPRHRGRTTWVWDVECADDEGRVCAMSRVTIAVRPKPGG
jgi:1,4-dihydroxy-2-naphthoyl-CoA hydrolase